MKCYKIFKSFTLAEVLITLTIIGVIAALTIPNLMRNYRKHQRISEIKTAYSIIQNAVRLSVAENGDVRDWDYHGATEFATKYIMPYLKIQKNCGHPYTVGLLSRDCFTAANSSTWYGLDGATFMDWGGYDSRWYHKVILENGMHLAIWAAAKQNQYPNFPYYDIHVNFPKFVFDVNGGRGKTIAGVDVFMFYLDLRDGAVKGMIPSRGFYNCSTSSSLGAGLGCTGLIQNNSWTFPEDYPVKDF